MYNPKLSEVMLEELVPLCGDYADALLNCHFWWQRLLIVAKQADAEVAVLFAFQK